MMIKRKIGRLVLLLVSTLLIIYQSANIIWNPAIDPENDSIVYSLYYSNNSGNPPWKLIAEKYGLIDSLNGRTTLVMDFG